MKSNRQIVLLSLLTLVCLFKETTALKCATCLGPSCTSPSGATLQNCTDGVQDTCVVISLCGYAERSCGIHNQYCTAAGFKQNQYGVYSAMQSYCSNINKQLQDSEVQSALICCHTDNCNGGTVKTATLAAVLICIGITFKLL